MPESESGDEFNNDVESPLFLPCLLLSQIALYATNFKGLNRRLTFGPPGLDRRYRQHSSSRYTSSHLYIFPVELTVLEGIGAADITKLKANGFYTVAVIHPLCFFYCCGCPHMNSLSS